MLGKIYMALAAELKNFFDNSTDFLGTTVLKSTQAKQQDWGVATINLVVVELGSSHEVFQCIGGVSQLELNFAIHSFFYDENSEMENDQGVNEKAYDIVDAIRRFMATEDWQTQLMIDCVNDYGIKFTLNGQIKSSELSKEGEGIIPGYTINYESVAIDTDTDQVNEESFATALNEGTTTEIPIKYNWLQDVISMITQASYNALTTATVGQRYYLTDLKQIYTVTAVNATTGLITSSTVYAMQTNDVFVSKSDETGWTWNGTALVRKYQVTITNLP